MKPVIAFAALLLASASLAASAGAQAPADFDARCEALAGTGHGETVITAATYYAQGRAIPAGQGGPGFTTAPHCLVEGMINQRIGAGGVQYGIGFELALPTDWQGRFLLMGGGGLNGSIRPAIGPVATGASNALARGFAVASHDSGHKGQVFDQSFHADQRAALDFAETSVRTVTLAARAITAAFYGTPAHHSYMTGCSTGGREGMLASQRYPELFDGIVVGAPAMRPGHSNLAIERTQVLLNATQPAGISTPAGVTPAERLLIEQELVAQCDGLDGREDGMIFNVEGCRGFDPSALSCRAGESAGNSCMAPERVAALAEAFRGAPFYAPIPWDTGITFAGAGLPGYLPAGQPGVFGPANADRTIDIAARINIVHADAVGRLTDTAYWTNLSTFIGRGAKLMFYHGVSDPWFSAFDTLDYFQRARAANGAAFDDAARFYMIPGMMHCAGGNAFGQIDLLDPIVAWAESGVAPSGLTASRSSGLGGERPLCPHPQYPHFTGGDADAAASYECRGA